MNFSFPDTSQLVQNTTTSVIKMLRTGSLLSLTIIIVLLVNTSVKSELCYRELELELEIRSALTAINQRLDSLETNLKKELKEAKELTLNQDDKFKDELVKIKEEIIAETERILPYSHVTGVNDVLLVDNKVSDEGSTSKTVPSDCKEVQNRGYNSSGPYRIQPRLSKYPFIAWCDMKTEKGGWTYLVNRFDGSQNFNFNWTEYRRGFGNVSGEHWLGLEHIYELTNSKSYKLLIEVVDWESTKAQAFYANFRIGNESEGYPVKSVGYFRGNTGDALTRHLGVKFSTPDRDHDKNDDEVPCAVTFKSGWWFADCFWTLLTGQYIFNPLPSGDYYYQSAIKWEAFHGFNYSLKEARMMIKPA